jgi:hypothetical protein
MRLSRFKSDYLRCHIPRTDISSRSHTQEQQMYALMVHTSLVLGSLTARNIIRVTVIASNTTKVKGCEGETP